MQKNLLILVHPHFEKSLANRILIENLENMCFSNLTIKNLYASYPDRNIDVAKEQADLKAHDRVIFQFPLYWYSSPSLLKEWFDFVFTPDFAYSYTGKSFQLEGKKMLISITTAGFAEKYTATGHNRFTIPEFLRPFDATAHFCKMHFEKPIVTHGLLPNFAETEMRAKLTHHTDALKKVIQNHP
jgi:putative NADPH-quinone reductase